MNLGYLEKFCMYNFYAVENEELNYELDKYIETILINIISIQLPNEIFGNIVKQMNLNYQWIEIRKFYNLNNSPLNLDFNLKNYENLCKKYIPSLTVAFVYQAYQQGYLTGNPTLYYITGPKKFDNDKENDEKYLNKFVDIIYHLNNESMNNYFFCNNKCINNIDLKIIKDIIINKKEKNGLIYSIQKEYYENFIKNVYKTQKWKGSIDIKKAWHVKMDIVKKIQYYHDQ